MRVLQINSICGHGSTGRIAADLHDVLLSHGHECKIAFGLGEARNIDLDDTFFFGNRRDYITHNILSRITDRAGFYSKKQTEKLISFIDEYKPDLIHIHNFHGYYMNIEILFDYFKKSGIPVVWTIHDCWPYTGHCAYYSDRNCLRWKEHCEKCVAKDKYPKSYIISQASRNYRDKKRIFSGVPNLTITTPSEWLANEIKMSFLKDYPIEVINNGIDIAKFKPTDSDFRQKYGLTEKKIILGVSSGWSIEKGFEDFLKLSDMLGDDYAVVIIGHDKPVKDIPSNMILIPTLHNVDELVKIYSAADIYVSLSVCETFGMPTVEALACGTPVLTYDQTALPEPVTVKCGRVVSARNVEAAYEQILSFPVFNENDLLERAREYDVRKKYQEFLNLYEKKFEGKKQNLIDQDQIRKS